MVSFFDVTNRLYVYFLAGEIVNLISVDSQKIEDACLMINLMWSCPLQVGLAIYFLYQTIGVSVFVGKTIFLLPYAYGRTCVIEFI